MTTIKSTHSDTSARRNGFEMQVRVVRDLGVPSVHVLDREVKRRWANALTACERPVHRGDEVEDECHRHRKQPDDPKVEACRREHHSGPQGERRADQYDRPQPERNRRFGGVKPRLTS